MELKIETNRGADGEWIAGVPELPGVTARGVTRDYAILRVKALARRVIAAEIEHGELPPEAADVHFLPRM